MPFSFQCRTSMDPNSTIFVDFSVRTCTAPTHIRTCNFFDSGGLVAHVFNLFEHETQNPIGSRYLFPSPISMLNPDGRKLHINLGPWKCCGKILQTSGG